MPAMYMYLKIETIQCTVHKESLCSRNIVHAIKNYCCWYKNYLVFVFVLNIISKSNLKQIIIHLCVSEIGGWPTTPIILILKK